MSGKKVTTVYLDMGRVITRTPSGENWQALVREVGRPEADFFGVYRDARYEYDKGTMEAVDFWQGVIDGAGQVLTEEKLARLIAADTRCWADYEPRMIDWSDRLRDAGYATGILSNMPVPYARFVRSEIEWFGRFSFHVLSGELQQMKPEPEIYRTALDLCGTPPDEVLFIDDLPENIEAARDAGMHGIVFTGVEDLHRTVTAEYGLPPIVQL